MTFTDEELIKLVLSGELYCFSEVVDRYKNKVYRLGLKFFKNELEAEEYAQSVFVKLFEKLQTFRGESAFSSWLYRLAYNLGLNQIQVRKTEELTDSEDIRINSERSLEEKELTESINVALNNLPLEYRTCLHLFYFEDMKITEIAKITGININTVKSNLRRGKFLLKEKLERYFKDII